MAASPLGARRLGQARQPRHPHPEEVQSWKQGDRLLLNGKMLTGRDAAHKRIQDMLAKGEELPVEFKGRVIYYVGPVDPVRDEVVGPAAPPPPRAWTSSWT
jgi:tartrate dehydratase beta subunit/fumarate hydratase class I family protein